jgi:hypothetical protein
MPDDGPRTQEADARDNRCGDSSRVSQVTLGAHNLGDHREKACPIAYQNMGSKPGWPPPKLAFEPDQGG